MQTTLRIFRTAYTLTGRETRVSRCTEIGWSGGGRKLRSSATGPGLVRDGMFTRVSFTQREYQCRSFVTSIPRMVPSSADSRSPAADASRQNRKVSLSAMMIVAAFTAAGFGMAWDFGKLDAEAPQQWQVEIRRNAAPSTRKPLRMAEVRTHGADSDRPWVIKGTAVYDITDWIESHPGGRVILRAAGSRLEPFWDLFTIHKKDDVYQTLEQFRIGELDPRDLADGLVPSDSIDDPFRDEPVRESRLISLTGRPFNAETPLSGLSSFITDTALFYVRHHLWVPRVHKASSYQITVDLGDGSDEKTYTLNDLRTKFPQYSITATLQCSGNRRKHMSEGSEHEASGLRWGVGAISNATWRGPRLRDVLRDVGLNLEDPPQDLHHAQLTAEDSYGASIPLEKAIDSRGDVLLACEMNGEPLPPDHGGPLRILVPGNTGARSVKWVNRIMLSDEESTSQWQRRDYKCFGPNQTRATINWDQAPAIQETPVQSAITAIRRGQKSDAMTVEGYAFSGGGRKIIRVDVSVDDGESWNQAEIEPHQSLGSKTWSWSRWRYQCTTRPPPGSRLVVKAIDEAYNVQPETHGPTFNFRGNLANAWHRVYVDDWIK